MKISGFTIVRNAIKYNYPVVESIHSILPICDEFIVNVGDSEDDTLRLIEAIPNKKIKIIRNTWNFSQGKEVLSYQTNLALKECRGDWAFYLQSDEVVHEDDLENLRYVMFNHLDKHEVDAMRFKWLHFYGSYYRYRIDRGWYQKQDRIIRNNGEVESFGDAFAFRRKDGKELTRVQTGCYIYHYGWVQPADVMNKRRLNADTIGFDTIDEEEKKRELHNYGDLKRFPAYFGAHPKVMENLIAKHQLSTEDLKHIGHDYKWHPMRMLRMRYKTSKRVREALGK